jgi:hypothetical protein
MNFTNIFFSVKITYIIIDLEYKYIYSIVLSCKKWIIYRTLVFVELGDLKTLRAHLCRFSIKPQIQSIPNVRATTSLFVAITQQPLHNMNDKKEGEGLSNHYHLSATFQRKPIQPFPLVLIRWRLWNSLANTHAIPSLFYSTLITSLKMWRMASCLLPVAGLDDTQ